MEDGNLFVASISLVLFEMICQATNRIPVNLAYFTVIFAAISINFLVFDLIKGEQ